MKEKLKKIIYKLLPLKNRIVFESNPEFSCNALPVYEEMVKRGIRDKYEIYWLVEDKDKYKHDNSGNKYLNYVEHGFGELKKKYILATSKALIFTNRFQVKHKDEQLVVNLMHGSPVKKTPGYYENDTCDYVITEASIFIGAISKGLNVPINKIVSLGFPRTDVLGETYDSRLKLGIPEQCKIIVWMPTFRKNKNSGFMVGAETKSGIPLFDTIQCFEDINNVLADNKVLLIIKLHPVEDISRMDLHSYSNIMFISDKDLVDKGLTSYKLLADSDALLTDYSSVYYDYLLADKPIGLVTDNLDEFTEKIGFYYGAFKSFIKGTYIETIDEFKLFIRDIGNGIDRDIDGRKWAIERYCEYTDFNSTKRVVDFIMERIGVTNI